MIKKIKEINPEIVRKDFLLSLMAMSLLALVLFILDIGCPTRFLTGICCPGCGMTRAVMHLCKGDVAGAIHYHPLVFTLPIIVVLFVFKDRINKKVLNIILITIIVLFIFVYIIRLLDPNNEVVYADITKSIIYKIIGGFYVLCKVWS